MQIEMHFRLEIEAAIVVVDFTILEPIFSCPIGSNDLAEL